ncbi:MAG: phosphatidylglycerol lysyltransferase domain-containing protein [Candidatus Amulumruptor caecigallinarius]|nr:phosphatidylglycerol lysyltransferase domain-containing protein [Candidatus Amulumruptor caecigallinarius]
MKHCNTILTTPVGVLNFKSLGIKDIPLLIRFFSQYPSRSCDFSVGGTVMWADYFHYEYCIFRDTLFIKGAVPDSRTVIFYKPIGELSMNESEALISGYCRCSNVEGMIIYPEEFSPDSEPESTPDSPLINDWKEYLYEAEKFRHFSGRKMEKKRNHLNYFNTHYPKHVMRSIQESDIPRLIAFTLAFDTMHPGNKLLEYECEATMDVLKNWNCFPFTGVMVEIDNMIAGYSFGEFTGDTFFCHVEKGNIEYRGIYQALASGMCNHAMSLHPEIRYLNREEDMGDESLRESKMSYHPILFVGKRVRNI